MTDNETHDQEQVPEQAQTQPQAPGLSQEQIQQAIAQAKLNNPNQAMTQEEAIAMHKKQMRRDVLRANARKRAQKWDDKAKRKAKAKRKQAKHSRRKNR